MGASASMSQVKACRLYGAKLVIAKSDQLSRDAVTALGRMVRPPVDICLGTRPSHAPKSCPLENTSPGADRSLADVDADRGDDVVLEVARGMGFVPNLPAVNGSTFPDVRIKSRKSAVHACSNATACCQEKFKMAVKTAILATQPTSYWPLDDDAGSSCHDETGLHDASAPPAGVALAAIPFGAVRAPFFDGALGSCLTIDSDPHYSQPFANALTVAVWICPLALDNLNVAGTADQYVHFLEKAVTPSSDVEWAMRLYNRTNPTRHSRVEYGQRPFAYVQDPLSHQEVVKILL
jgi:hypothetical protein